MSKLQTSKYLAGISLAVMGIGFLLTLPFRSYYIGLLLLGGFEAGLIGGMADWFAVTALFRHPLGIPIPHTALLPKNRKRIIGAIISMLENDWITKESIKEKIKQTKLTEKLLEFAEKELLSDSFTKWVSSAAFQSISSLDFKKISPFIEKELKQYSDSMNMSKFLQNLISQAMEKKFDIMALDYFIYEIEKWISMEETKLKIGVAAKVILENIETDGLMKIAINTVKKLLNEEKLGNLLQPLILSKIIKLKNDDDNQRLLIISRISVELVRITDRESEINGWLKEQINHLITNDNINAILKKLQEKLISLIQDERFIDKYVLSFIQSIICKLKESPEKIDGIENWIQKQITDVIEKNHSKIGALVKENLDKLDDETLINMIENNIGKDLQWIRVNGAVCGFFIGIVLAVVKALL